MKKKILALLLVLTMAISIVACGSKPNAQDNNKETVQNSETESAEPEEKELTVDDVTETDLLGNWVNKTKETEEFVLEKDGICRLSDGEREYEAEWKYEDKIVEIDWARTIKMEVEIVDGKIQLVEKAFKLVYIEKDASEQTQ